MSEQQNRTERNFRIWLLNKIMVLIVDTKIHNAYEISAFQSYLEVPTAGKFFIELHKLSTTPTLINYVNISQIRIIVFEFCPSHNFPIRYSTPTTTMFTIPTLMALVAMSPII